MKKHPIIFTVVFIFVGCSPFPEILATQTSGAWTPTLKPTATKMPTPTPSPTPIYPQGEITTHLTDSNIKYHWVS